MISTREAEHKPKKKSGSQNRKERNIKLLEAAGSARNQKTLFDCKVRASQNSNIDGKISLLDANVRLEFGLRTTTWYFALKCKFACFFDVFGNGKNIFKVRNKA